ncbi:MAG TPA: hypothetical protein VGN07_17655 [Steroidobacteraceae bacterium]|jgi:hypothetical protein
MNEIWQQRLDSAFDKYFAMSKILQRDMEALLSNDDESESSRRNFIRAAASLIEGYAHCFREMCAVGLETGPGALTAKEENVLKDERGFGSIDRIKYTLRGTYRMFQLPSPPEFSDRGWVDAQALLKKRDALMHPKSVEDLSISEQQWLGLHSGAVWVLAQLFGFMAQLAIAHGTQQTLPADAGNPRG